MFIKPRKNVHQEGHHSVCCMGQHGTDTFLRGFDVVATIELAAISENAKNECLPREDAHTIANATSPPIFCLLCPLYDGDDFALFESKVALLIRVKCVEGNGLV
jgi:hypothetical protein